MPGPDLDATWRAIERAARLDHLHHRAAKARQALAGMRRVGADPDIIAECEREYQEAMRALRRADGSACQPEQG